MTRREGNRSLADRLRAAADRLLGAWPQPRQALVPVPIRRPIPNRGVIVRR